MARIVGLPALGLVILGLLLCLCRAMPIPRTDEDAMRAFGMFRAKYAPQYANNTELVQRFEVFKTNMRRAAELQARDPHATYGVNAFADRTEAEMSRRRNAKEHIADTLATFPRKIDGKRYIQHQRPSAEQVKSLPSEIDWRKRGVVNPIKNQGQCGSCWAFGAIANIESMWAIAGNALTSLAEQELVSCDNVFAYGCDGSASVVADWWLVEERNGTVATEQSYPYVSGGGTVPACNMSGRIPGAQIIGAEVLLPWDAEGMAYFLANRGPLTVAVDASAWSSYTGGIMTNCENWLTDHQVAVVGYGTNGTLPYWIVRNSWGTGWGEEGYMRIVRGRNCCQIELLATSATVPAI